ncbi:MAG: DUF2793 domain-containing protein [Pseudomonadota bacterium]
MANTANLNLPLLEAAQAQKHVTVNEALAVLDGLSQAVLRSITTPSPPGGADEGALYAVPGGAGGDWAGEDGKLAVFSNGGWVFVTPRTGWSGWVADQGVTARYDGTEWQPSAAAISPGGAASIVEVVEIDHDLTTGTANQTVSVIPANSVVFGVSGRVLSAFGGSLTSWQLGVAGSANRYGSGLGTEVGAWVMGLTGQPQAYYSDTPLELTATGGAFQDGRVRLAVHIYRITLPR